MRFLFLEWVGYETQKARMQRGDFAMNVIQDKIANAFFFYPIVWREGEGGVRRRRGQRLSEGEGVRKKGRGSGWIYRSYRWHKMTKGEGRGHYSPISLYA